MMRRVLFILLTIIFFSVCVVGTFCLPISNRYVVVKPVNRKPLLSVVVPKVLSSVVYIINETQGWQGSGVVISKDIILTARHVLEGGEDFTVTTNEGKEIKAYKAISHNDYDIGFLKVDEPILNPCELVSVKELKLGQNLFVISSQFNINHFNSVTQGIVSAVQRDQGESWGWQTIFQIDAGANPGSSGGPVFNMTGEVIGIVVGSPTRVFAGVIYVVPTSLIIEDLGTISLMFALNNYYVEKEIIKEIIYEETGYY